jgi:hypothetical protein
MTVGPAVPRPPAEDRLGRGAVDEGAPGICLVALPVPDGHVRGNACGEFEARRRARDVGGALALGHARASGARELSAIVAVGNCGRGPVGPCGRDRQILFDYHPGIRVILPTPDGIRSVRIIDLMPLGALWTPDEGTQPFDPAIFTD